MRRRARRWAAGPAGAVLLAASAAAFSVVDQQQTAVDPNAPGFVLGGVPQQQVAQTVTAGVSGELEEVRLPLSCTAGELLAQIQTLRDGDPSGVVVSSRRIPAADLPPAASPGAFRGIVLSPAPFFSAGERFAVVLSSSGLCEVEPGPPGDSYGRGEALFRDRFTPSGTWFALAPPQDLPFQTLVQVPDGEVPGLDEEAGSFVFVRCFIDTLLPRWEGGVRGGRAAGRRFPGPPCR